MPRPLVRRATGGGGDAPGTCNQQRAAMIVQGEVGRQDGSIQVYGTGFGPDRHRPRTRRPVDHPTRQELNDSRPGPLSRRARPVRDDADTR